MNCNIRIGDQPVYANTYGTFFGMGHELGAAAVSFVCFSFLAFMVGSTHGDALTLLYLVMFGCMGSVIASLVQYYRNATDLDAYLAAGRPCMDPTTGEIVS